MPDKDSDNTDMDQDKWITVGGKKMKIPAGEEGEEALREKLPSTRGAKESNTKEAQKTYNRRFGIMKTLFKLRENVVFAEYKKSGII